MRQVYPFFTLAIKGDNSGTESLRKRTFSLFSHLTSSSRLSGIGLSIVPALTNLPVSAALDWKGEKIVAISVKTIEALDDDELLAVLAHELGHIAHRDSLRKTMATAYKTAFVFDPVARFVEAAVYRDGELHADEYSANLTGKPAALASALIKIYESVRSSPSLIPNTAGLSLLMKDHDSGLFSKQPSLTLRIKRLLEMERRLQTGSFEDK
jgi:heat shock protein HtpX